MSEWFALAFVAAALYFVECLVWIEAAAVACFKAPLRSGWKCAQGATLPGNERGGVGVVDPVNVRGSLVVCHLWPFSISPDGLTNLAIDGGMPSRLEPDYIAFDEFETVRADFGEIHVNGKRFAHLTSSVLAIHLADRIQRVWQRPLQERASEIKAAIEETLDDKAVIATWAGFQQKTRTLSVCCSSLFAFTFLASPLVLFLIGPYPSWQYLLVGLFVITLATAVAYFRTHAALYPHCPYDRWVHALSMMLLPVAAIRCVDKLSRDALCCYSSAVVLPILCNLEDATPVLRQQFIDLRNGPDSADPGGSPTSAGRCAHWFHQILAAETKAAFDRLSVAVLKAPVPDDGTMMSYCPRCHAQFGHSSSNSCPSCSGVQLVTFNPAKKIHVETGA